MTEQFREVFRIDAKQDAQIKAAALNLLRLLKAKTGDNRLDKHIARLGGVP